MKREFSFGVLKMSSSLLSTSTVEVKSSSPFVESSSPSVESSSTVEEQEIIEWIKSNPLKSVKDISQFFKIDKKILNKKLYSLLSRGILIVNKEINPPKWSVNEKVCKIIEEVPLLLKEKGGRATKDLASHFSVKKSELNKVLYSLQKLNIVFVEKDDEGKNPVWSVTPNE